MGSAEDFFEGLIDRIAARLAERLEVRLPQPQPSSQPAQHSAQYLKTKDAAKLLGIGVSTLELWRKQSKGPSWIKLPGAGGAVRYSREELSAWLAAHRKSGK